MSIFLFIFLNSGVYFVGVRVFQHYFVLRISSCFSTLICTFLVCGFSDIENYVFCGYACISILTCFLLLLLFKQ